MSLSLLSCHCPTVKVSPSSSSCGPTLFLGHYEKIICIWEIEHFISKLYGAVIQVNQVPELISFYSSFESSVSLHSRDFFGVLFRVHRMLHFISLSPLPSGFEFFFKTRIGIELDKNVHPGV